VKALEDEGHRLVVIAAGYPEEMQGFLQLNPGLASRFGDPILFPDYTPAELREILSQLAHRDQYQITEEALTHMTALLNQRAAAQRRSFGNARAARNLWEEVKNRHAEAIYTGHARSARHDLGKITLEDVPGWSAPAHTSYAERESSSVYGNSPAHVAKHAECVRESTQQYKAEDRVGRPAPDWKAAPIKLSEALGLKPSASAPVFQNTIRSGCDDSGSFPPPPNPQTW